MPEGWRSLSKEISNSKCRRARLVGSGQESDSPRNAEAFDRHAHQSCRGILSFRSGSQAPTLTFGRESPHRAKSLLHRADYRTIAVSPESLHHEIIKRRMERATKQEEWNVGKIGELYA